jgi:hypothetical protein
MARDVEGMRVENQRLSGSHGMEERLSVEPDMGLADMVPLSSVQRTAHL